MELGADVTLGGDAIAIERLKLELDRMNVEGRAAYAWANDERPARLDAAITAPEIDLDRVNALSKALLGGAAFDWPRDVTLSLKIGRAIVAGVEAKQTDVNMRIGANGIEIERLAIADFGGAALAVKAQIDTKAQTPRGALTLDFDARTLDGLVILLEKVRAAGSRATSPLGGTPDPGVVARFVRSRSRPSGERVPRTPRSRSMAAPASPALRCKVMSAPPVMPGSSTSRRSGPPR